MLTRAGDDLQPKERALAQPRPLRAVQRYVFKLQRMYFQELAEHLSGHACMLQYAMLHLYGYAISMDDIKNFRVSFRRLLSRYTTSDQDHSKSTPSAPVTPSPTTHPVLKSQLVLLDKVSPTLLVSPLLRLRLLVPSTSPASRLSTTTHTHSSVMDAPWRVLPLRLLQLLVTCSSAT